MTCRAIMCRECMGSGMLALTLQDHAQGVERLCPRCEGRGHVTIELAPSTPGANAGRGLDAVPVAEPRPVPLDEAVIAVVHSMTDLARKLETLVYALRGPQ